jgi:hypothetical protein
MAKLIIDLQAGRIEVDGDEKFVERMYSEFREATLQKLSNGTFERSSVDQKGEQESSAASPARGRRRGKVGGPSCASRIEALKGEDFFKTPRSPAEVREKLAEKGSTYDSNNIAAALSNLTKASKVRRFKDGGNWKYQNP